MRRPPPVEEATILKRLIVYGLLVVLAVLVAGFYGVVHNQISYTVSPEYFTKFKFRQFGFVHTPLPGRVRAAMVGFLAAWWMGIPLGLLVNAAGFVHRGHRRMFRFSLWSLGIVVAFTLLVGLVRIALRLFQDGQYQSRGLPGLVHPGRRGQLATVPLRGLYAQFFVPWERAGHRRRLDFSSCDQIPDERRSPLSG